MSGSTAGQANGFPDGDTSAFTSRLCTLLADNFVASRVVGTIQRRISPGWLSAVIRSLEFAHSSALTQWLGMENLLTFTH